MAEVHCVLVLSHERAYGYTSSSEFFCCGSSFLVCAVFVVGGVASLVLVLKSKGSGTRPRRSYRTARMP